MISTKTVLMFAHKRTISCLSGHFAKLFVVIFKMLVHAGEVHAIKTTENCIVSTPPACTFTVVLSGLFC